MSVQTWGIPPNTWDVGATAVKAHRVVQQESTNYRKVIHAQPGALSNLIGVTTSSRDPKDSVGVRQIGEDLIECAEPIDIGDRVVVAADGGTEANAGRIATKGVANAGTTLVGIARSQTTAPGQLCEVDLKNIGAVA